MAVATTGALVSIEVIEAYSEHDSHAYAAVPHWGVRRVGGSGRPART